MVLGSSTLSCVDTDNTLCCSPYFYPLLNTMSNHVIFETLKCSALDTQGALHARNQLWMDAMDGRFTSLSPVYCASLLLSREEQGVCLWRKCCVGVGSIPVFGNTLSILCCCNAVVSFTERMKACVHFQERETAVFIFDTVLFIHSDVHLAGSSYVII